MQKLSTLQFFLQFFYWSELSHSTGDGEVGKWLKIALARVKFAAQSFGNYVRILTHGDQISEHEHAAFLQKTSTSKRL